VNLTYFPLQILQSGAAGTLPLWDATERSTLWPGFVKNIPACASLASSDRTLECLRNVSSEELRSNYAKPADESFLDEWWGPTLDFNRPGSLLPDFPSRMYERGQFARIPFIGGNNLDEGWYLISVSVSLPVNMFSRPYTRRYWARRTRS
jgi:acetylcholinesterase